MVMRANASLQLAPILCDHANNTSGVNDKIKTTVATRRHVRSGFGPNIIFCQHEDSDHGAENRVNDGRAYGEGRERRAGMKHAHGNLANHKDGDHCCGNR